MVIINVIFFIYSFSIQQLITNGIYYLATNNLFLFNNKSSISLSKKYLNNFSSFRIIRYESIYNVSFYNIEEISTNYKLTILKNRELYFKKEKNKYQNWDFFKTNDNNYVIKNEDNCYINITNSHIFCEPVPIHKAT